jgi:hypothetical protein
MFSEDLRIMMTADEVSAVKTMEPASIEDALDLLTHHIVKSDALLI